MSTIKVIGKGVVKVKPDTVKIKIFIRACDGNYYDAVNKELMVLENVLSILDDLEISRTEFKTSYYVKNFCNIPYENSNKTYDGFEIRREGIITTNLDLNLLEKLKSEMDKIDVNIKHHFTVLDKRPYELEALSKAYDDAYEKAKTIASVSTKTLDDYKRITYIDKENKWENGSYFGSLIVEGFSEVYHPEEFEIEQAIEIVWKVI